MYSLVSKARAITAAAMRQFQSPQLHSATFAIHSTEMSSCSQESLPAALQGLHPILPSHTHAHKSASLQDLPLDFPTPHPTTTVSPLHHASAARTLLGSPIASSHYFGAHLCASSLSPHTCKPTTLATHCNLQHLIWPSTQLLQLA